MTTATRPTAAQHRIREAQELQVLIVAALAQLEELLHQVRDLVDGRRVGAGGGGGKLSDAKPAPIAVGAFSLLEEVPAYYDDLVGRLTAKLHAAGVCHVKEPTMTPYGGIRVLVRLVANPDRLKPIHRELEGFVLQARRVIDGSRPFPHPDPCPHCGRRSLLVHPVDEVIRCERDPDTNRQERCRCSDSYCPCQTNPKHRHQWLRAQGARGDGWYSLRDQQRLRAREEHDTAMALEALDRIRELHRAIPTYPYADDCEHADLDDQERTEDGNGDPLCITCDPIGALCSECTHPTDDEATEHPCPTIRAIDPPDTHQEPS